MGESVLTRDFSIISDPLFFMIFGLLESRIPDFGALVIQMV